MSETASHTTSTGENRFNIPRWAREELGIDSIDVNDTLALLGLMGTIADRVKVMQVESDMTDKTPGMDSEMGYAALHYEQGWSTLLRRIESAAGIESVVSVTGDELAPQDLPDAAAFAAYVPVEVATLRQNVMPPEGEVA